MSSALAKLRARSGDAPRVSMPSLAGRGGIDSGVHRLIETPLSINGAVGSTILRFLGGQAAAGGWPEYGGADTLALQAGTVPSYNQGSPFIGSLDDSVKANAGGHFAAAAAGTGDITTEDYVVEALIEPCGIAASMIAGKRNAAFGWQFFENDTIGTLAFYNNGAGAINPQITGPSGILGIQHVLIGFDASDWGQLLTNTVAGSSIDTSQTGSLTTTEVLRLLAKGASTTWTGRLFYFALHLRDSWHQSGAPGRAELLSVATQRFALLTGTRPLISIAASTGLAAGGNVGPAYQERIVSSAQRFSYMGASAPRFVEQQDGAGRTFRGICIEAAAQNLIIQSSFASWTAVRCSFSATAVTLPDGSTGTANAFKDSVANSTHWAGPGTMTFSNGTLYQYNVLAKDLGYPWCALTADGGVNFVWFNAATGAIGTQDTGMTGRSESKGGGWYRFTLSSSVLHGAANAYVFSAPSDGVSSYAGTVADRFALWRPQITAEGYPSSPIVSAGAATTRAADAPHRISGAAHFGPTGFSLFSRFLAPSFTPIRSHYLWTAYKAGAAATDYVSCFIDTSGRLNVVSAATAGNAGAVQLSTNRCTNLIQEYGVSFETNRLRLFALGAATEWAEDTAVDLPAGLDTLDFGADNAAANQAGPILPDCQYQLLPYAVLDPNPRLSQPGAFVVQG